ncbi:MAG: hypothetical protein ACXWH0_10940 [Acidimicrobiia bacterium]
MSPEMLDGGKRMGGWGFALLIALSLPGPRAWADAGNGRADVLCAKAATAERDAKEAERKSEERQRFLKGKGGIDSRNDTLRAGGDSAAVRQSVKARLSEVRALLPQLRQGAAAAAQDRGIVPGLSQFFAQMESNLSRMLQAADACLDAPQFCSVPPVSCPPIPAMPAINHSGSANFVRQVQQSYAQSANQFRQACQNLNAGIVGDVERLKRESRPAGPTPGLPGIAPPKPFGDTDLYLRRAENLRREASLSRQEADRVSGVRGYCGARSHVRVDAKNSHAIVDSLKAAERRRKTEADFPLDGKVIDLKMEWEKKWDKGMALNAPNGPLPKLRGGEKDEASNYSSEGDTIIRAMNSLAKRLGWSSDEQSRLEKALNKLSVDGGAATVDQVNQVWETMLARGNDGSIALKASQGSGPGFPGAGQQTKYQDCTIFALANAADLPYGVVATRATELIRQGEWRGGTDRANPQKVIEQSGLNGGEVIMLAESFGRAEVVPSSDFAKTLNEGRRVLVNVVPRGGSGGHEVVLTKAFQHDGENWYEMMDSNQGPIRRLYLSHKELSTILQENGVAFRSDPGKTPTLLRSGDGQ